MLDWVYTLAHKHNRKLLSVVDRLRKRLEIFLSPVSMKHDIYMAFFVRLFDTMWYCVAKDECIGPLYIVKLFHPVEPSLPQASEAGAM